MSPWSGRTDPDGNMYNYFTIDGPNNFPGWENEEVNALLKQARTETSLKSRAERDEQAQEIIAEETPLLFLAFPMTLQAPVEDWIGFRIPMARYVCSSCRSGRSSKSRPRKEPRPSPKTPGGSAGSTRDHGRTA